MSEEDVTPEDDAMNEMDIAVLRELNRQQKEQQRQAELQAAIEKAAKEIEDKKKGKS